MSPPPLPFGWHWPKRQASPPWQGLDASQNGHSMNPIVASAFTVKVMGSSSTGSPPAFVMTMTPSSAPIPASSVTKFWTAAVRLNLSRISIAAGSFALPSGPVTAAVYVSTRRGTRAGWSWDTSCAYAKASSSMGMLSWTALITPSGAPGVPLSQSASAQAPPSGRSLHHMYAYAVEPPISWHCRECVIS